MSFNSILNRIALPFLIRKDLWYLKGKGINSKLFRFAYYRKLDKSGSYIGHGAQFESIPSFPHGITGIFISGGVTVGKNCTIFQHVTIAANDLSTSKNRGYPVIGDNCLIGANSVIIGNVHIGNNCYIGAGVTVAINIPDNSVVVSQTPRILSKS